MLLVEPDIDIQEDQQQQQQDDERGSRDRLDACLAHHANSNRAKKESRGEQDDREDDRGENGESAQSEDDYHGDESDAHEDWNVSQRPLVPALTFDELLPLLTRECTRDIAKNSLESRCHLE